MFIQNQIDPTQNQNRTIRKKTSAFNFHNTNCLAQNLVTFQGAIV